MVMDEITELLRDFIIAVVAGFIVAYRDSLWSGPRLFAQVVVASLQRAVVHRRLCLRILGHVVAWCASLLAAIATMLYLVPTLPGAVGTSYTVLLGIGIPWATLHLVVLIRRELPSQKSLSRNQCTRSTRRLI